MIGQRPVKRSVGQTKTQTALTDPNHLALSNYLNYTTLKSDNAQVGLPLMETPASCHQSPAGSGGQEARGLRCHGHVPGPGWPMSWQPFSCSLGRGRVSPSLQLALRLSSSARCRSAQEHLAFPAPLSTLLHNFPFCVTVLFSSYRCAL